MNDCCAHSLWHGNWHFAVVYNVELGLITKPVNSTTWEFLEPPQQMASPHSCVFYHHADDVRGLNCESQQYSRQLSEQDAHSHVSRAILPLMMILPGTAGQCVLFQVSRSSSL